MRRKQILNFIQETSLIIYSAFTQTTIYVWVGSMCIWLFYHLCKKDSNRSYVLIYNIDPIASLSSHKKSPANYSLQNYFANAIQSLKTWFNWRYNSWIQMKIYIVRILHMQLWKIQLALKYKTEILQHTMRNLWPRDKS